MRPHAPRWKVWVGLLWLALGVAAALILGLAPAEQTLGQGIKWVYIHTAIIWTAMLGLVACGGLGLAAVLLEFRRGAAWRAAAGWVTFGLLILAVLSSLAVMQVNWGGISWNEPRTVSLLRALALWLIVQVAGPWVADRRWRGALTALAAGVAVFPMRFGPLLIHPENPMGASGSAGMRFAFIALFGLCLAASASVVWVLQRQSKS